MSPTPLVIEAAVNGVTSKRRNPHVPRTVDELVQDAHACFDAGAAIVHHHTEDQVLGSADVRHNSRPYLEVAERVLAVRPGALLYPTMAGGRPGTSIAERYAHIVELHAAGVLGLAVCDPGSVNLTGRRRDGTVAPVPDVYANSPADVDWMFAWCRERDVPVHVSIFEPGFLRLALGHLDAGTLPRRVKIQFYLGGPDLLFGLPASVSSLDVYLSLLGDAPVPWMVGVQGGDVAAGGVARAAIERGGHVRVGLEDFRDDSRASPPTNAELVDEMMQIAATCGRPVASCADAFTAFWPTS